jgi:hypothetical protein
MHNNGAVMTEPDLRFFDENRAKFPLDQLLLYAGQHVAWSPDGTQILAAALTRKEVNAKLDAMGIERSQVVHDFIDPPLG